MHGSGGLTKNREGLGAFTYWRQVDASWTRGGAANCQNNILHMCGFAFHMLVWLKLPILTGKKLDSSLVLTYQPLLSFSHLPHIMNAPSLLLFSPVFHSRVLLWLQTEGKTGEDWKSSYFVIVFKKCSFQIAGLFFFAGHVFVVKCD